MTRTERQAPLRLPALLVLLAALAAAGGGCVREVEPFPEPGGVSESSEVLRSSPDGPIVVTFASFPLKRHAPPEGMRLAMSRAIGSRPCSAASFYWTERQLAQRWLDEEFASRRRAGVAPVVVLAGHGLGATEACELAREILFNERDATIALLLTVDAVKTGRLGSAAGVTGNAIVTRLPGVNHSFTAYDAAPVPDGRRVLAHINYYQTKSAYYHGTAMPGAENHQLADWTNLLNHGNADDFALPFLISDLRRAMEDGR